MGLMGFGGSNHLVLKLARHKFPNAQDFCFQPKSEGARVRPVAGSGLGGRALTRVRSRSWMRSLTPHQFGARSAKRSNGFEPGGRARHQRHSQGRVR
ncbi:MAG: hypothetical protein MZV70_17945 [Desulfobacterales bacterium]|nr:hypothetical protein [Desulfobacterales bacterium]